MRKLTLLVLCLVAFFKAKADEGMWTLYNLPNAVYEQMKAEGFSLPYDALYKSNDAIMKGVVNFSGFCSGVVVSPSSPITIAVSRPSAAIPPSSTTTC